MTTFDDRERAYEAGFAHDQDLEFKIESRRDRMLGLWAGELMGLSGEALEAYARSVIRADLKEPGDEDVFQKVMADLAEKEVDILPNQLRERMKALLVMARAEVMAGK